MFLSYAIYPFHDCLGYLFPAHLAQTQNLSRMHDIIHLTFYSRGAKYSSEHNLVIVNLLLLLFFDVFDNLFYFLMCNAIIKLLAS